MRRTAGIIIVVILLVGVGLGVFLSRQKQDIRQHAAETSTEPPITGNFVALVGTQGITNEMVDIAAKEQYAVEAITPDVRRLILDVLIERAILDQEAAKDHITLTDAELSQSSLGDSQSGKYELLKKKIIANNTESREAYVIGYWVPPSDYSVSLTSDQKDKIDAIRKEGKAALDEAATRLAANEDVLTVAESLIKTYPSLKETLGVNGYILSRTVDQTELNLPRIYTKDPASQGQPFFDTLFSMNENEVKTALADKDAGGSVIKLTKVHHAQYPTYVDFLAARKKELVKQTN